MNKIKIGVFLGSFRKKSHSRQIADHIAVFMKDEFDMHFVDFGYLDLFNQKLNAIDAPEEWELFGKIVNDLDGFLYVTPEYNRTLPPVLRNVLDIGSGSSGNNAWGGKPGAVIGLASGEYGSNGINQHVRQCMVYHNIYLMQQPEAYRGNINILLDQHGALKDEKSKLFLMQIADLFGEWVKRFVA